VINVKKQVQVPQDDIHLFEEHSSTLPVWWARHESPRTVVYLDAHLDLQRTGDDTLTALKACTTLDEVRALESPHHLEPSTRYAYGIENFLYAAHRLGLIDRLVWVAPPHIPRHYSSELIDYVQQMDGISFDELTSFVKFGGNAIRGTLFGLDITICDYDELDSMDIGTQYYLDIDIDYFVHVPSDRLWIDPAVVIDEVLAQLGEPMLATISRAVSSGFTPLAFRYVGDYIHSLLAGRNVEFEYYQQLTKAIFDLGNGKLDRGRNVCGQLIDAQSELAAAYYILALATEEAAEKKRLLTATRNCDDAYGFDFTCEASGLLHRKKPLDPGTLHNLATALERLNLENAQLEQAEIALALVYAGAGDIDFARSVMARQTGNYVNHEDLLFAISTRQLQDSSKREQNREMLAILSSGVKNATAAQLHLGDFEFADGNHEAALTHYQAAQEAAPAWMLPLRRMLDSYRQSGLNDKASAVEQLIRQRQQRLQNIID
jgi:tetratricopeptide (TPR) repeat protein